MIKENLEKIQNRIQIAEKKSGRSENSVKLMAVSKFHPVSQIIEAVEQGQFLFGENRVQEAVQKFTDPSFEGFKNPMLYYPNTRNVTLCGMIPSLNNLKFQFSFLEPSESVFVWTSPLYLNDKSLNILNRMNGVFKNWINELKTSEDIKPMSLKNKD